MTEIRVRNVEPWIVDALHKIAKANHRSMENEIKEALLKLAKGRMKSGLERLDRLREKQRREIGILPDSTPEIRAEREEW